MNYCDVKVQKTSGEKVGEGKKLAFNYLHLQCNENLASIFYLNTFYIDFFNIHARQLG